VTDVLTSVFEFANEHKVALTVGVAFALILTLTNRIFTSYRDAGQERYGIYLGGSLQQWLLFALFTSPMWLISVIIHGTPVEMHFWDLGLTTPIAPQTMLNWTAALALAMAFAAWAANAVEEAWKIPPTRFQLLLPPRTAGETIVFALLVAPTAGITEEIVFRGMLLPFAIEQTGDLWLGIAATSAVFGLVHFPQGALAVVATGTMGAVLAIGFVYSSSLWPCIVAHILYDMAYPFLVPYDELAKADAAQAQ
jgi:membrane protease YdiL (CAAX protease family)